MTHFRSFRYRCLVANKTTTINIGAVCFVASFRFHFDHHRRRTHGKVIFFIQTKLIIIYFYYLVPFQRPPHSNTVTCTRNSRTSHVYSGNHLENRSRLDPINAHFPQPKFAQPKIGTVPLYSQANYPPTHLSNKFSMNDAYNKTYNKGESLSPTPLHCTRKVFIFEFVRVCLGALH